MASADAPILHIPTEITEHALVLSRPCDVASFAQTCRSARALVYDTRDQHLWRRLYLEQLFDDPRRSVSPSSSASDSAGTIDWKKELQKRVYVMRVIQNVGTHPPELADALEQLLAVVTGAPHMPEHPDESNDLIWLTNLVREHGVFGISASASDWTEEERQRLAELWSYIGWRDSVMERGASELLEARNSARCFVYDLRNYSHRSIWGPFVPENSGLVNWKHIDLIIIVIYCNLLALGALWPDTRPPCSLDAIRAYSAPGSYKRDPRDWAGVEGIWRRYVCFMDYRDLFTFNFSSNSYDPSFFDDAEFQEATRLIELDLHITRVAKIAAPDPTANPAKCQQRPMIHFEGSSRGGNGNEARVRGTVRMTPDGHIRWRFVSVRKASIYDGHSQWSSEGIQIGNVCSAAGVVGTWTGAHHEEGDPAGPFWLWKVEDDHPSHLHGR